MLGAHRYLPPLVRVILTTLEAVGLLGFRSANTKAPSVLLPDSLERWIRSASSSDTQWAPTATSCLWPPTTPGRRELIWKPSPIWFSRNQLGSSLRIPLEIRRCRQGPRTGLLCGRQIRRRRSVFGCRTIKEFPVFQTGTLVLMVGLSGTKNPRPLQ